jgi:uncharacterized membrane protein YeaQ/YmgE (transglycosylase-associated protein family)
LGLVGDLVVGIAGAFIASWIFPQLRLDLGSGLSRRSLRPRSARYCCL